MEKRLAGIEKNIEQLWQAQGPVTSRAVDSHPTDGVAQEYQSATISELGEIDSSENAVDGMGAMNFTDEEDSGFFGMRGNYVKKSYGLLTLGRSIIQHSFHEISISGNSESKIKRRAPSCDTAIDAEAWWYGKPCSITSPSRQARTDIRGLYPTETSEYLCSAIRRSHSNVDRTIL